MFLKRNNIGLFIYFLILSLMIGLRNEVGGDWRTYKEQLEKLAFDPDIESVIKQDYAYYLINIISIKTDLGVYLLNLISAIIFSYSLIYFCRNQPRPWLSLVVAVPYLIIVVAMGYTRQSVALGIIMVSFVSLTKGNYYKFIILVALAATFHKSAIIVTPFALFLFRSNRIAKLLILIISMLLFFIVFLQEYYTTLIEAYIDSNYQSSGAEIRILMNLLPSIILILLNKKFNLTREEYIFWNWMAFFSFIFLIILQFMPSSTAIDRLALYWIPIQIFVLNRIPNIFKNSFINSLSATLAVNLYSLLVLITWLNFAATSFAWLPYRFYPIELFISIL